MIGFIHANRRSRLRCFLLASSALVALSGAATAQTWNGSQSTDWDTAQNWENPESVPDGSALVIVNGATGPVVQSNVFSYLAGQQILVGSGASGVLTLNVIEDNGIYIQTDLLAIGDNGGSGTLNLTSDSSFNAATSLGGVFVVGNGLGSTGVANIISTGKNPELGANYLQTRNSFVGASGGSGVVNIDGGSWSIWEGGGSEPAPFAEAGLHVGSGAGSTGVVNVLAGGKLNIAPMYAFQTGDALFIGEAGGSGVINVEGEGPFTRSALGAMSGMVVGTGAGSVGALNVLAGGKAFSSAGAYPSELTAQIGTTIGVDGGTGNVLVSGPGSQFFAAGAMPQYYEGGGADGYATVGDIHLGVNGSGTLTIADGGEVVAGTMVFVPSGEGFYNNGTIEVLEANGVLYVANGASATGVVSFGGAPGAAPAAPGALSAAGIVFGGGAGTVAFNHTSDNFAFNTPLSGAGEIANYAGVTWINTDNRTGFTRTAQVYDPETYNVVTETQTFAESFSGRTSLYGGALGLGNDGAIGSSSVTAYADSSLLYGAGAGTGVSIANPVTVAAGVTLGLDVTGGLAAIQSGAIGGAGSINKTGAGVLTLQADNSLSGDVLISDGVLALAGAGEVSAAARVVANSVFDISAAADGALIRSLAGSGSVTLGDQTLGIYGANDLFAGIISGAGGVNLTGGVQTLSGPNSYAGDTSIGAGATLRAAATDTFSPQSNHQVLGGGLLDLGGFNQTVAALGNAGAVMFNGAPGVVLNVTGDYVGAGGALHFNTVLGGSDSPTDRLVIGGDTAGDSGVFVTNVGGPGAQTTGNGIQLVSVAGASNGQFALAQRVASGAYEYTLHQGGPAAADGAWYLRSTYTGPDPAPGPEPGPTPGPQLPNYRAEVPLATSAPVLASQFAAMMLGTYHDRSGGQGMTAPGARGAGWARMFGALGDKGDRARTPGAQLGDFVNHGAAMSTSIGGFQAGLDLWRLNGADGSSTTFGLFVGGGRATGDVGGIYGGDAGRLAGNFYGVGAYATHVGAGGWYLDAVGQATWSNDYRGTSVHGVGYNLSNTVVTASLEGGYPLAIGGGWIAEPQAQIIYQNISTGNVFDRYGSAHFSEVNSGLARVGVRLSRSFSDMAGRKTEFWARANLWRQFGDGAGVEFRSVGYPTGVYLSPGLSGTWAQLSLGISGTITQNASAFASADYEKTIDGLGQQRFGGRAGIRISW